MKKSLLLLFAPIYLLTNSDIISLSDEVGKLKPIKKKFSFAKFCFEYQIMIFIVGFVLFTNLITCLIFSQLK